MGSSTTSQQQSPVPTQPDIIIQPYDTDTTIGTSGSIVLIDSEGASHLLELQFEAANDAMVWLYYRKDAQGGKPVLEHYISLGPTYDVNDPNYWKMDGFMVSVSGNDLVIRARGHQPSNTNPQSPYGAQGCGRGTYLLQNVWSVPAPGTG